MVKYFINYDLRDNRNYKKLYDELVRFKAIQVLESLYCIENQDNQTEQLRDHFKKFIDNDDGLIIIKSAYWAGVNLNENPNDL